jgi:transposase-like protein
MRNILKRVRVQDRLEVARDLKEIFASHSETQALELCETMKRKWKKAYPKLFEDYLNRPNMFTYFKYPSMIWGSIRTTNWIENTNKQLKRQIKKKEQFPNEGSAERFLVNLFTIQNEKLSSRIMKGFELAYPRLAEMFEERSDLSGSSL